MKWIERKYQDKQILCDLEQALSAIPILSQGTVHVLFHSRTKGSSTAASALQNFPLYSSRNQSLAPGIIAHLSSKKTVPLRYEAGSSLSANLLDLQSQNLHEVCRDSDAIGYLLMYALFQEYIIILKSVAQKAKFIDACKKTFAGLTMGTSQAYKKLAESWPLEPSKQMKNLLATRIVSQELRESDQVAQENWYEQKFCSDADTSRVTQFDEKQFQQILKFLQNAQDAQDATKPMSASSTTDSYSKWLDALTPSVLKSLETLFDLQKTQQQWLASLWGDHENSLYTHMKRLKSIATQSANQGKEIGVLFSMQESKMKQIKNLFEEFHYKAFPFPTSLDSETFLENMPENLATQKQEQEQKQEQKQEQERETFHNEDEGRNANANRTKEKTALMKGLGNLLNSLKPAKNFLTKSKQPTTEKQKASQKDKKQIEFVGTENLAQHTMNLLDVKPEIQTDFLSHLTELYKMRKQSKSSSQAKKSQKKITDYYWRLWEQGFQYWLNPKVSNPEYLAWFLHLGVFDERWITQDHMKQIRNLPLPNTLSTESMNTGKDFATVDPATAANQQSTFSASDWLQRIYNRQEENSWNTDGESLIEVLNKDRKPKERWATIDEVPEANLSPNTSINFEISNFIATATSLATGRPLDALPFFTSEGLGSNLSEHYIDEKKLEDMLTEFRSIDFSIFYRSVVYHNPDLQISAEFIQREIRPYFVLLPISGNKGILWQELGNKDRNSQGRIAIPRFSQKNIRQMLIEAMGAYRWDITKIMMGADWNNIGVPSITSIYTDYIQFIRKNKNLSTAAREKAQMEFKKHRSDRDRFVNDYVHWLESEAKGIPKLNKVAREIFYYQVPFASSLRKKLSANPIYDRLDTRLTNLRLKKYNSLSMRYKNRSIPKELEENLAYYKL